MLKAKNSAFAGSTSLSQKYPINPQMVMFTLFKGRIVYECSMFHISTELTV